MNDPNEGYRVVTGSNADPTGDDGRVVFASLFEEEPDANALSTFPVVHPPGTELATHRHTEGLAACVVSGAVTLVFGADGDGVVELEPGDYVWIRSGVMHDERTGDGVEMVVAHLAPFETIQE